jgi:hypothetical protein
MRSADLVEDGASENDESAGPFGHHVIIKMR